jgi:hypothetical protein
MKKTTIFFHILEGNIFFFEIYTIIPHEYTIVFMAGRPFLAFRQPVRNLTNSVAQEPEGSSPHSQQPATGLCPEPVEFNPHQQSQSP